MLGLRLPAVLLATALLALGDHHDPLTPRLPFQVDGAALHGTWEVLDVRRSGIADATQVGASLTFAGNEVSLQRKYAIAKANPSTLTLRNPQDVPAVNPVYY